MLDQGLVRIEVIEVIAYRPAIRGGEAGNAPKVVTFADKIIRGRDNRPRAAVPPLVESLRNAVSGGAGKR